ncbi:MAG: hypothetical protein J3R72DRAFT_120614 [Linnemannia gamsii]|nr:MAG: hypothetical protein J3R72DRAFT_120614 [Linnemannia gamsii]
MDSAIIDQPNDIAIGHTTTSKALFIAEILAGCAAATLAIAIVCCFCSRAARRRLQHGSITGQDPFPILTGEMRESGRQTPDAAPAYSSTSPLGPLSPEVVDAISRVSADCRHSLVVSILSSAQSIRSPHMQSRQPSNISSIDIEPPRLLLGSPSIRSTATSIRSSTATERPSWDSSREARDSGEFHGIHAGPWFPHHRASSNPPGNLIEQMRQSPPSYDPAWRESLHIPPHRGRHRPLRNTRDRSTPLIQLDQEYTYGPEATRDGLYPDATPVQAWPHRRTGSFNTPHGMPAHMFTPSHQRGPPVEPLRTSSRRSISWTGAIIRLGSSYSGSHHQTNPPANRSHLSSSWLPQPADTSPSSSRRNSSDTITVNLQHWQQDQQHLPLNDSIDDLYPPPPEYALPAESSITEPSLSLDDVQLQEPITIESLQHDVTDSLN